MPKLYFLTTGIRFHSLSESIEEDKYLVYLWQSKFTEDFQDDRVNPLFSVHLKDLECFFFQAYIWPLVAVWKNRLEEKNKVATFKVNYYTSLKTKQLHNINLHKGITIRSAL